MFCIFLQSGFWEEGPLADWQAKMADEESVDKALEGLAARWLVLGVSHKKKELSLAVEESAGAQPEQQASQGPPPAKGGGKYG